MDKATFDKYCEERYMAQMKFYSDKSGQNQKKYRRCQWILIVLSALTPVVAALSGIKVITENITYSTSLNILVVIIASVVAILTTGMKTFNYQELWITYRATNEKLKPEIYYYNFNIGDYGKSGIDKESLFVSRVEAILDTEHNQWPPAKKLSENQNKSSDEDTTQAPVVTPVTTPVDSSADNSSIDTSSAEKSSIDKSSADNSSADTSSAATGSAATGSADASSAATSSAGGNVVSGSDPAPEAIAGSEPKAE